MLEDETGYLRPRGDLSNLEDFVVELPEVVLDVDARFRRVDALENVVPARGFSRPRILDGAFLAVVQERESRVLERGNRVGRKGLERVEERGREPMIRKVGLPVLGDEQDQSRRGSGDYAIVELERERVCNGRCSSRLAILEAGSRTSLSKTSFVVRTAERTR